jgi:hypothetical protein
MHEALNINKNFTCVIRFDVMGNLKNLKFYKIFWKLGLEGMNGGGY